MDDSFDDDLDGAYLLADAGKKCTVYVVDGSVKMFEKLDDGDDDGCTFRRAIKIIRLQMVNKALTSKDEYTACVFINSANKSNDVEHVYVWQDTDIINGERVQQVDQLLKSDDIHAAFKKICGGHGKSNYSEVLFLCIRKINSKRYYSHIFHINAYFKNEILFKICFSSPKFQKRVVYLFTNESNPFDKDQQHLLSASKNAEDLLHHAAEFAIFPLLAETEESTFNYDILVIIKINIIAVLKYVLLIFYFYFGFDSKLKKSVRLCFSIPRKQYARRTISSIPFDLGGGVKFAVGIYSLMRQEKLPTPLMLDAEDNVPVQRSSIYVDKNTDEELPLLGEEIKAIKEIGGAEAVMTADEIERIRRICPPGLLLLGFKSLSSLKLSHHVRSSQYVFPQETSVAGSTHIYRALWEACLRLGKMIVCRYTQKENTPPKLVVLVPQGSTVDSNKDGKPNLTNKFIYPGFHLVYLPFMEDKRDLTEQMTHPSGTWPIANSEQISAARDFIRRLTVSYHPEKFSNPVLQKHYKVIEGLALNSEEIPEVVDQTQPYFALEAFQKRVEKELARFRELTLPDGYNPEAKNFSKSRKAPDTDTEVKKKQKRVDTSNFTLEDFASRKMLSSLTVAELKAKALDANIPFNSKCKKSDLITAINSHYGIK
uniref:Ku domain-containing protein n=1 Tax=Syphacia muris TaxID=451379 RepID=A0A0N5AYJ3_9BILA